jgi:hypothetical protein
MMNNQQNTERLLNPMGLKGFSVLVIIVNILLVKPAEAIVI